MNTIKNYTTTVIKLNFSIYLPNQDTFAISNKHSIKLQWLKLGSVDTYHVACVLNSVFVLSKIMVLCKHAVCACSWLKANLSIIKRIWHSRFIIRVWSNVCGFTYPACHLIWRACNLQVEIIHRAAHQQYFKTTPVKTHDTLKRNHWYTGSSRFFTSANTPKVISKRPHMTISYD